MTYNFKKLFPLLFVLILLNAFCYFVILNQLFLKEKVAFLDVGEADSELIVSKAGNILIDAGSKKVLNEIQETLPIFDKTIDCFILSHPDRDHFLGIFDVLNYYKVKAVILMDIKKEDSLFEEFIKELKAKNILVITPNEFFPIKIKLNDNNSLTVFSTKIFKAKSTSQHSLISLYQFNNSNFLFTGDIDSFLEFQLIPVLEKINKKIDVLKVSHHGSKYSTGEKFLDFIKPKYAVIETGKNNYGHPHPEVIERLKKIEALVFRTDINGKIVFLFKNNDLIYLLKKDKI